MLKCSNTYIGCLKRGFRFVQVEELNSLVSELAKVTAKEQASLEQCKDFLTMIATMQVMQPFRLFCFVVLFRVTQIMILTFIICGTG